MTIKTYAIHGLTEWHGDIKSGTISVRVSFTGGTASPSGAVPAYYMTKDPVTQFVIENSKEFKSGFIRVEMQQTVAGEHPRLAMPSGEPEGGARGLEEAEGAAESKDEEAVTKTFACNDDAKDYMVETYNVSPSKMRSRADIEKVASENGVKIIWG